MVPDPHAARADALDAALQRVAWGTEQLLAKHGVDFSDAPTPPEERQAWVTEQLLAKHGVDFSDAPTPPEERQAWVTEQLLLKQGVDFSDAPPARRSGANSISAPGACCDDDETSQKKDALASLEALIETDPEGVDPEVRSTADELRASIVSSEPSSSLVIPSARVDIARPPGGIGPALPPGSFSSKRKRGVDEVDRVDDASLVTTHPPIRRAKDGEKMHPRNVFANGNPCFKKLAALYPALAEHVVVTTDGHKTQKYSIDFTNWDSTVELNRALLTEFYGIKHWHLPKPHLCPPIANRANYIHWLEDLLFLSRPSHVLNLKGPEVKGLDVGVGASVVYPIIGAAVNGWRFVGVDITDAAVASAAANVSGNEKIKNLVEIRDARSFRGMAPFAPIEKNNKTASVLLPAIKPDETFAFSMCNPPFFESLSEAYQNPGTDFGGTCAEVSCPGGEENFVTTMFNDSVALGDTIHWFTTMCGKKDTTKMLKKLLHGEKKVTAVRSETFYQGKTTRWGVAWSFSKDAGKTNTTPLLRER